MADPVFKVLQNEVKLYNFSARYMLSTFMKDYDELCLRYEGAQEKAREIAKNLLKDGVPIDVIARNTKLPEKVIREL